ncbi:MAG TPA: shikimate dehydrogenase, partial [Solirubrobacteraceae bacterium]
AERLCAEIGGRPVDAAHAADLLVNCTAAGLAGAGDGLETLPVTREGVAEFGCVVDLVYGAVPTALVEAARAAGVPSVDGREVLVHQGALSLECWTGRAAPVDVMRRAVQLA